MLLGPHWCSRMPFVQVLAPFYRDVMAVGAGVDVSRWFVIPHLVDTDTYQPASDRRAERASCRTPALPPEAFVVLGVGDFSTGGNKRLDWLVREVGSMPRSLGAHLVLVGQASPSQLAAFDEETRPVLGDRLHLLRSLPRQELPRLYRIADVFAHAATREPFGIVFLEAMASGLPLAGHPWEVTRWIVGDAGALVDMNAPGALRHLLEDWASDPSRRHALGAAARSRAVSQFSPRHLVPQYLAMYQSVRQSPPATSR